MITTGIDAGLFPNSHNYSNYTLSIRDVHYALDFFMPTDSRLESQDSFAEKYPGNGSGSEEELMRIRGILDNVYYCVLVINI